MNYLKGHGSPIGALAVAAVDNPMLAGTGHRICNDCSKACIYQKQEPVDIPQVETRTLRDVLELPWGFEIYSLLTRWNPLNLHRLSTFARSAVSLLILSDSGTSMNARTGKKLTVLSCANCATMNRTRNTAGFLST